MKAPHRAKKEPRAKPAEPSTSTPVDKRFYGDRNRQAYQEALEWKTRVFGEQAEREWKALSPKERAEELLRYVATRAVQRPGQDAHHNAWASFISNYPHPFLAEVLSYDGPLFTPAEISLGQVLDALPEDSPWLARLELADEDFGRPIGDGLRLRRWSAVLIDVHFGEVGPEERSELVQRFSDAVWRVYQEFLATQRRVA